MNRLTRRSLLTGVAGVAGVAVAAKLAGQYGLIPPDGGTVYGPGETLTYGVQRLVTGHALAREFPRSMISRDPFANPTGPLGAAFEKHRAGQFRDWQLQVGGLVAHPMSFSLADLRSVAARSHITEVACEEGWSYIAEWIGTPLSEVLREVQPDAKARYVVYRSYEPDWWDSIDMQEALHPQTLVTWGMNDADLPVIFGGPLRLRLPRQLGYKSVKYLAKITLTDTLKPFGKGLGSASPEGGYSWYAGI
jgi:DMSO/TMAO reductase YedYZ molybdopterin-dependent catalytic subunit